MTAKMGIETTTLKIDLKELAVRESEQIEWKENVARISSVVKTIVAFANDFSNLGGGYVVCGAKETKDEHGFQTVKMVGWNAARLKELEGEAMTACRKHVDPPLVPLVEYLPAPNSDRRVLVFIVPASPHAHLYRTKEGEAPAYFVRISSQTIEARNGILRELLVKKKALDPWDRRPNSKASLRDVDLIALRDALQDMHLWDDNRPLEDYLSYKTRLSSFVPPLTAKPGMADAEHPLNFTLLLFAKRPTDFVPGAYCIFSIYQGTDRGVPVAERVTVEGTLIIQARKLIDLLNTQSYTVFEKTSDVPNLLKYPQRALQEAVVNALVHRDYELDQPIRITVFSDRIEINSPGSLPRTIDPEQFRLGKAHPFWRNQSLAYFFNKLQLAQAEGQGIPTILRTMKEEGCPAPDFQLNQDNLICILPAHPRHKIIQELNEIENRIILGEHEKALERLEIFLEKDPLNYRSLELLCEVNNLMRTPRRVFQFLKNHQIRPSHVNVGTGFMLGKTLSSIKDDDEAVHYVKKWLDHVSNIQLEGVEVKRLALNYRRMGLDEDAISLIDQFLSRDEETPVTASLLDIRARAKIELAKKCMDTARTPRLSPKMKSRAWEQCRTYLHSAEDDLERALVSATSPINREYIQKDLSFLQTMKDIAKKPRSRRRHPHQKGQKFSK